MLIAGGTALVDGVVRRVDVQVDGVLIEEVVVRDAAAPATPAPCDGGEPPIFDDDVLDVTGCQVAPGLVEPLDAAQAAMWPVGEWEAGLARTAREAASQGVTTLLVEAPGYADGPFAALAEAALSRVPALDEAAYRAAAPAEDLVEGAPADLRVIAPDGRLAHVVLRGELLF
ncbi:MAG: hypothetical protein HFJ75_06250 [Eggerthellaceae bacterium]|nr:hypothetical protein [Eggerthellaceae bacterium]